MMKNPIYKITFTFFIFLFLSFPVKAQTGGTFDLSHNVIASGGGSNSTGGGFSIDGTAGQNLAGTVSVGTSSTNNQLFIRGGFWAFDQLAPTAANALIKGRIKTSDGAGIRNVLVTLSKISTGEVLQSFSSSFGYYQFSDLPVGEVYILTVKSKTFSFSPNSRIIFLSEELTDEDFIALPKE